MKRKIMVSNELFTIFREIENEGKTLDQWAEIESCDMFQEGSFVGGFDATEMEFTFNYYDESLKEWWFQLPLEKVLKGAKEEPLQITAVEAS